jgi:hypothetical protein
VVVLLFRYYPNQSSLEVISMSHLTCYRLTAISIGISLLTAIATVPVNATEVGIIADILPGSQPRSAIPSQPGLDIGLQPIILRDLPLKASSQPLAIQPGIDPSRNQPLGLGVSTRIGTLGIGVDVAKSFTPQLNGRLGFNFGNLSTNRTDSGINYDAQLNLSSIQLLGDYYPFTSSGFRVTGGLVAQSNKFSVTSKPGSNGSYTIDNVPRQVSEVGSLTGDYTYSNSIAPYVGIGIGKSTNDGFGFNADLGVIFAGSPKVTLNASNPTFNNNPITRAQIDNQARQTENDLKGFNLYPVLSVGLSYGF